MPRILPTIPAIILLLAVLSTSIACSSALDPQTIRDPALLQIREAFVRTVDEAFADPKVKWVHGHDGNALVARSKGKVKGYCWQWQERVYRAVRPVAESVGWRVYRININRDVFSEHHSVVVFPRSIAPRQILTEVPRQAYVLDPWQHGAAEIFTLEAWLDVPWIVFEAAALEDEKGLDHRAGDDPEPPPSS